MIPITKTANLKTVKSKELGVRSKGARRARCARLARLVSYNDLYPVIARSAATRQSH